MLGGSSKKKPPTVNVRLGESIRGGRLLDLGGRRDFFLRFRLRFLLFQTNLIFPDKRAEFRIVILLAV